MLISSSDCSENYNFFQNLNRRERFEEPVLIFAVDCVLPFRVLQCECH